MYKMYILYNIDLTLCQQESFPVLCDFWTREQKLPLLLHSHETQLRQLYDNETNNQYCSLKTY